MDNLSAGGLFITTNDPRPVGTILQFEFSVRDGGVTIAGKGVVQWTEKDTEKKPGMGIKFLELNEEGRKELSALLKMKSR